MSWYSPKPRQLPKRLPRRQPIKAIPSALGDEGLVANWLFYYLKGGDHLHDFSPYDNHGEINGAKWVDGRYGWALEFDGSNDYVNVPDSPSISITQTDITLMGWVYLNVLKDYQPLLPTKTDGIISASWDVYGKSDGTLRFNRGDGTNDNAVDFTYPLVADEWVHLAIVQSGWDVTLYKNGVAFNTLTMTSVSLADADTALKIGTRNDLYDSFDGIMAIIRIYDTAKSASFVDRRLARTKGIFGL